MRIDQYTKLIGRKVLLVPYRRHQNEELRRLTASERLSLEEEYEMQARLLVGDVNIFINGSIGELTVVIAESKWRRKGLGEETVWIMLRFVFQVIGLRAFEVKISKDNVSSLKLFQKIGFVVTSQCSKFHEYTSSIGAQHILEIISRLEVTVDNDGN
ncbi:unnamed protein product [Acanthocheilonema viteae]|uniref:N-acetyltransferase domain-containing protein n=1 Tax=Acanthocheilonema viteae TaxID=6277 RepID=A0A498S3R5_ACAVI|nr:unnamed protein product [Acanthocheilonema viteae]